MDLRTNHKLKKNWGAKADALDCYAYIKYIDPLSKWACYVYAIDPNDEENISCLIISEYGDVELCQWKYSLLMGHFNKHGEYPLEDDEYRPIHMETLLKRLKYEP